MSENDLNTDQVITDPDLNNADAVDQQSLTDQVATGQNQEVLADGTDVDKTVKYSELKKAIAGRDEEAAARKAAEEQATYAQRQLELMQMQQQKVPAQQLSSTEQAMKELGLTADDLYGSNQLLVLNRKDQLDAQKMQQQNSAMMNQQFVATHPDASQVVGSVHPVTGQLMTMSPELIGIFAMKPYLRGACIDVQSSYNIVMQERKFKEYETQQASIQEHQIRQEVDNTTLPLGGSAAGGGGAGVVSQNQKLLTREQVAETERKIASGEIT